MYKQKFFETRTSGGEQAMIGVAPGTRPTIGQLDDISYDVNNLLDRTADRFSIIRHENEVVFALKADHYQPEELWQKVFMITRIVESHSVFLTPSRDRAKFPVRALSL